MTDPATVITPAPGGPDGKRPWQSKTLWISAIIAVLPLAYPASAVWVAANPTLFSAAVGIVFGALRLVTQGRVSIS